MIKAQQTMLRSVVRQPGCCRESSRFTIRSSPCANYIRCQHHDAASKGVPSKVSKEPLTPLARHLKDMITFNGPISVGTYMRQALTNPLGGYYMQKSVFGQQGDFVTSPEISQAFGEVLGVWFMINWTLSQRPQRVQYVELGPGTGTLAADIVRALSRFTEFQGRLSRVVLVEASPKLRNRQLQTLCQGIGTEVANESRNQFGALEHARLTNQLEIYWVENIADIEYDDHTMLMAHEFFDALPVYKFKKIGDHWREIMVDVELCEDVPQHFRYVLAPEKTHAIGAFVESTQLHVNAKDGAVIEMSPESTGYIQKIGNLIGQNHGTALIMDYGNDFPAQASLRAIRDHKFVDLFTSPGEADLSADVDFSLLKWGLAPYISGDGDRPRVKVFGPTTQRHLLISLGIEDRIRSLVRAATSEAEKAVLRSAFQRLVGAKEMGVIYKAMAVTDAQYPETCVGFERPDFPARV